MLFTLYPPKGAHVKGNEKFRSTWLRPIVDGEEGYKYIGKALSFMSFYNKENGCILHITPIMT